MRRRRFLAALGLAAGLAGCSTRDRTETDTLTPVDPPDGGGVRTGSPTPESPTSGGETPGPHTPESPATDGSTSDSLASVVDLDTLTRTYALSPTRYRSDDDAEVRLGFAEPATADRPALVRGRLHNAASRANTFRLDETPPFGPGTRTGRIRDPARELTYRSELVFAPTENHGLAEHVPAVERAPDGSWRLADPIDGVWNPERVRLDGDEGVVGEWYLVGRAEGVDAGRPTGRYEFRSGETDLTVTVWNTRRPGPEDTSRFAGQLAQPLPDSAGVNWYHEAGPGTAAYLEPNTERISLPESVDLTLHNHTGGRLTGNSWNLYKLHDGTWYYLEPGLHTTVLHVLPPGGRRTYRLRAFGGPAVPCEDAHSVGFLGGGTYAFEAMYSADDGDSGQFAALLELEGPPVEVVPTENATAERDGSTVRVEWPRRPELPRATLAVERVGGAADTDAERLLPEQVMRRRNHGLRNALAFVESGVGRVVLRADRNTVQEAANGSGYTPSTRRFVFDGEAFAATATFDG